MRVGKATIGIALIEEVQISRVFGRVTKERTPTFCYGRIEIDSVKIAIFCSADKRDLPHP